MVGHSLGALVVAKYPERGRSRAVVLLAPIPQAGSLGAIIRLSIRHPLVMARANLTLRLRPFVIIQPWCASSSSPPRHLSHSSTMSGRSCGTSRTWPSWTRLMVRARPERVRVPVLIMGAEHDGFFTERELRRTAAAYRTQAEMVAGIGHDMMLDLGWQQVADRIDAWIRENVPDSPAPSANPTR